MALNLITDRTTADIGVTDKGSYNATDLNRVAEACEYLNGIFNDLGYSVDGYSPLKNDWYSDGAVCTDGNIPVQTQMQEYLSTVSSLKAVFSAEQKLPSTMRHLTVDDANNIEKLLLEVESQLQRLSAIFVCSGAWNAVAGLTIYAAN